MSDIVGQEPPAPDTLNFEMGNLDEGFLQALRSIAACGGTVNFNYIGGIYASGNSTVNTNGGRNMTDVDALVATASSAGNGANVHFTINQNPTINNNNVGTINNNNGGNGNGQFEEKTLAALSRLETITTDIRGDTTTLRTMYERRPRGRSPGVERTSSPHLQRQGAEQQRQGESLCAIESLGQSLEGSMQSHAQDIKDSFSDKIAKAVEDVKKAIMDSVTVDIEKVVEEAMKKANVERKIHNLDHGTVELLEDDFLFYTFNNGTWIKTKVPSGATKEKFWCDTCAGKKRACHFHSMDE